MAFDRQQLKLELTELTNVAMRTEHTLGSGILLATIVDYLSHIDRHKDASLSLSKMKTTKKELISFVEKYFQKYISELNGYLDATGKKGKYGFDDFTAEDFVEMFYRVKHSFTPYENRGFEFTFYGTIAGHAEFNQSGKRKQFCLNPGMMANYIVDVIECYFDENQTEAVKRAIDRFCSSYKSPYPISYL